MSNKYRKKAKMRQKIENNCSTKSSVQVKYKQNIDWRLTKPHSKKQFIDEVFRQAMGGQYRPPAKNSNKYTL